MRSRFDEQLGLLNRELIEVGALCEEVIALSAQSLTEGSTELAARVAPLDEEIDRKEREIESLCLKLLLQQQPVAKDLRQISAALKMITDMERIGDQAEDIAEIVTFLGGRGAENSALLSQRFDTIFFTGSVAVGKVVMEAAAKHLTPVTLELGGKSPVIVDKTADLKLAARRIAFGKVLNAGQTCVEPDYLLIEKSVKPAFIEAYRQALHEFFPDGSMDEMPVIVSEKHFARVTALLEGQTAVVGGEFDEKTRFVAPTLLDGVSPDSPVMQEEIFGPILPMLEFDRLDEAINFIRSREKPLALYLFTSDKAAERRVLDTCSFGGGCINDTIIHLATTHMPFGGVGNSGMGSYHGKKSFDTFTHARSIVKKSTWLDLPMRYHPYSEKKLGIIKRFMK